MKKAIFLVVAVSFIQFCPAWGGDTANSNPDGLLFKPIFLLGGSFGHTSLDDKYTGEEQSLKFVSDSYSFLFGLDVPSSRSLTWGMRVEYLSDKTRSVGIYEGIRSGFQVSTYLKIFSR
jgi:hypothetical protein